MKKVLYAAVLQAVAAPAFAEMSCTRGNATNPIWERMKVFEDSGGKVLSFKINDGLCYEIYGEADGKKMEVFYDLNSGVELERIDS